MDSPYSNEERRLAMSQLLQYYRQCRAMGSAQDAPAVDDVVLLLTGDASDVAQTLAGRVQTNTWSWWREAILSADRVDLVQAFAAEGHAWTAEDAREALGYEAPLCQEALLRRLSPQAIRATDRSKEGTLLGLAIQRAQHEIAQKMCAWTGFAHQEALDDALWQSMGNHSGRPALDKMEVPTGQWAEQGNPHREWQHRQKLVRRNRHQNFNAAETAWTRALSRWLRAVLNHQQARQLHPPVDTSDMEAWLAKQVEAAPPWSSVMLVQESMGSLHQATLDWEQRKSGAHHAVRLLAPLWSKSDPDHGWIHVLQLCQYTARYQPSADLLQAVVGTRPSAHWDAWVWRDLLKTWCDILIEDVPGNNRGIMDSRTPVLHLAHAVWEELPWVAPSERQAWQEGLERIRALVSSRPQGAEAIAGHTWLERCHLEKALISQPPALSSSSKIRL